MGAAGSLRDPAAPSQNIQVGQIYSDVPDRKWVRFKPTLTMCRKADCWDDAPTESFFNSLKNERVHGARYKSRADAQADLFDYIETFYNRRCRHSTLGYRSPVEVLTEWFRQQHDQQAKAA